MKLTPKNWSEFQHYKDRSPEWIKLHRNILDNYEFQCLPVASRALAPMLWLLASEYEGGVIDATLAKLAFRLRMTEKEVTDALNPLIEANFFSLEQDASKPLADCKQDASLEKSKRREEKEKNVGFENFWKDYPKTPVMSKKEALKAWKLLSDADQSAALAAVAPYKEWLAKKKDHPVVHACRFLSQRRFEGFQNQPEQPGEVVITEFLMQRYKVGGNWHHAYGPEPGSPGCRASPDLLAKYGYATEAA